jgi:hypothetical protein
LMGLPKELVIIVCWILSITLLAHYTFSLILRIDHS